MHLSPIDTHRLTRMVIRTSPPNVVSWWSRAIEICRAPYCSDSRARSLGIAAAARAAAAASCRNHTHSASSVCGAVSLLFSQHALMCIMHDHTAAAIKWGLAAASASSSSVGGLNGCIHALKASASLGHHLLPAHRYLSQLCCRSDGSSSVPPDSRHFAWHASCSLALASKALLIMHGVISTGNPLPEPSALDPHSALFISPSAAFQRSAAVLFACSLMMSGGTSHPPSDLSAWCAAAAPDINQCSKSSSSSSCIVSALQLSFLRRAPPLLSYRPPLHLSRSAKIIFLSSDIGTGSFLVVGAVCC
jgi:hypothetical protein